jgi:5,10-methylene-tetrahydrofolate dehydrogenase/methenyl tetrahydrofolate cyclohydrolase
VGRPLASMLAHDGARVYSFDIDGPLLFSPPTTPEGAHRASEIDIDRARALAESDIVVTGVPSQHFELIRAAEIRPGAVCINFSTYRNFHADIIGKAGAFAPRVGPMTVVMALRNALRLYLNTRGSAPTRLEQ